MKNKLLQNPNKGFTIIELMIAVAIIGVLAQLAIAGYSNYIKRAKLAEALQMMGVFKLAVTECAMNIGASSISDLDKCNSGASGFPDPQRGKYGTALVLKGSINYKFAMDYSCVKNNPRYNDGCAFLPGDASMSAAAGSLANGVISLYPDSIDPINQQIKWACKATQLPSDILPSSLNCK